MVDLDLGGIATGAAANLAADLVKAARDKLKVLVFGTEDERALERCLEAAFADLLQTLVEASDRERLDSSISGRLAEAGLDGVVFLQALADPDRQVALDSIGL